MGETGGITGGAATATFVPIVMSANLSVPAEDQALFAVPIHVGGYQIILGPGAELVGV